MFLLVNNRPIQSADSIGFWPIVSVSADSQNSTIGRPLNYRQKRLHQHTNWNGLEVNRFEMLYDNAGLDLLIKPISVR